MWQCVLVKIYESLSWNVEIKIRREEVWEDERACSTETTIVCSFNNRELWLRLCYDKRLCLCDGKRYGYSERKYRFRVTTRREGFCNSGIRSGIVWSSTFIGSLLIVFSCVKVGIVYMNRILMLSGVLNEHIFDNQSVINLYYLCKWRSYELNLQKMILW